MEGTAMVQPSIRIITPGVGAPVPSPVDISGVAQTFEGAVAYRVRDAATNAVVAQGHLTATVGAPDFGDFQVAVPLPAGSYRVECLELSVVDGSEVHMDSRPFTVQ
jgi:hypothetical protein